MRQSIRCGHVDDAVERLLAGMVHEEEETALRAHGSECPSCGALLDRVDALAEGPPVPPEPDDLVRRRGFLAMEAKLRQMPPRFGFRPVAIAAAAVLVALGIGLAVGSGGGTDPARIATTPEPEGIRWAAPPGGSAAFDLGSGTRVVLSEGAMARVAGIDGPTLDLTLASGLLVGELRHGGPVERIRVYAPRGRVEITGTTFAVRLTRDEDVVAVLEGVVRVSSADRVVRVGAGEAVSIETLGPVDIAPLAPVWRLVGAERRVTSVVAATTATEAAEPEPVSAEPAAEVAGEPEALASRVAVRAAPEARAGTPAGSPAEAATPQGRSLEEQILELERDAANSPSKQFALAQLLMRDGQLGRAYQELNVYLGTSPSPQFAEQALHMSFRIAKRRGRLEEARRDAREYLRRFPNGAWADEADAILGQ